MHHGQKNFEVTAPRSKFYQGGFGRLFPELEPWAPDITAHFGVGIGDAKALEDYFMKFAKRAMIDVSPPPQGDATLPSGYVYLGQFIDHDLTLDTTPLSEAELDPNRLHNFRTPRLDLDCLYGTGPETQPYLYDKSKPGHFRIGSEIVGGLRDLPRLELQNTALIGDPRNDENVIVAQLHAAFLMAHNTLVDAAVSLGSPKPFELARKTLRWLYQWLVWNDYIERICQAEVFEAALHPDADAPNGRTVWKLGYEDVYDWKHNPFMPVEFSVAAYRFGHSLVRSRYQTNVSNGAGLEFAIPIFASGNDDLRGGRRIVLRQAVQWDWFFLLESSRTPNFPQMARKFDSSLAESLRVMPEHPDNPSDDKFILNVLAARNLVRGVRMQLPAASDVARFLDIDMVPIEETERDALWYYILREAEFDAIAAGSSLTVGGSGERLGTMGSILVAATFAGLLKGDPLSYFNLDPAWTPENDDVLKAANAVLAASGKAGANFDFEKDSARPPVDQKGVRSWTIASIIRLAGLPVDGGVFLAPPPAPGGAGEV